MTLSNTAPTQDPIGPYFKFTDGFYHPQPICRGPWDPQSLTGSVIIALLAHGIESSADTRDYLPARLTVDMYRLPGFAPVEIQTRIVRDGYRIKVIDADFISDGESMARATCQLLRKTQNPAIRIWGPQTWQVPLPEDIPATPEDNLRGGKLRRAITGAMGTYGQKQMWLADLLNLVDDIALTPWMRAALVADLTNPWANSGEGGVGYINSDATLYLHREPVDEWIGMQVVNHQATDGVAIGECYLYDRLGQIGSSSVTGLAQKYRPDGG